MDSTDSPTTPTKPPEGPGPQSGLERLWSQALVAVSAAGEEVGRTAQKLAERAGLNPEEMRGHLREFTERLTSQRKDVEGRVEEAARRALASIKVPRREQIQELQARLDALEARVSSLAERR
ncbi:MAG TPA: phasin family protein [Myxococcales bacterium]|nr:phasin family protein [Myxococcales bacterium]